MRSTVFTVYEFKNCVVEGDRVYIKAGAVYKGEVYELTDDGVWVDENPFWLKEEVRILDFVAFADITEWAIE